MSIWFALAYGSYCGEKLPLVGEAGCECPDRCVWEADASIAGGCLKASRDANFLLGVL